MIESLMERLIQFFQHKEPNIIAQEGTHPLIIAVTKWHSIRFAIQIKANFQEERDYL